MGISADPGPFLYLCLYLALALVPVPVHDPELNPQARAERNVWEVGEDTSTLILARNQRPSTWDLFVHAQEVEDDLGPSEHPHNPVCKHSVQYPNRP